MHTASRIPNEIAAVCWRFLVRDVVPHATERIDAELVLNVQQVDKHPVFSDDSVLATQEFQTAPRKPLASRRKSQEAFARMGGFARRPACDGNIATGRTSPERWQSGTLQVRVDVANNALLLTQPQYPPIHGTEVTGHCGLLST